ncbi:hypothetical protein [Sporisorium scitamineum]|uniref:Uncharacterized protein n=1 Tax=Sporisorium scitamineum TaxID=49012 RepID=A0A0F7S4N9_9BASI|nr:hypothetical protein [Sporisorium scitamineum]
MNDEQTPAQPSQQADPPASPTVAAGTSAPARPPTPSARRSQIPSAASTSSTAINFARPIFLRQESVSADLPSHHSRISSTDSSYIGHASSTASEDAARQDGMPLSPWDRRAANSSTHSHRSGYSTPLKIRRRGMINDKKLTINVSSPVSSNPNTARRTVSESNTPSSSVSRPIKSPARPLPAVINPPADNNSSPGAKSSSTTTASPATSSDRSDKPLVSAPRYGFNPDFQLGFAASASSSPKSNKGDPSPAKPSPTYSGHTGPVKSASPRSHETPGILRTPSTPRTPRTPRTPKTPLTARLPHTPGLSSHSAGSYRGILLTTVTRAASDERVPTKGSLARLAPANPAAPERRNRNRSASIATEITNFARAPSKRHSLAAAQPSTLREKPDKVPEQERDDSSPRARVFARSLALDKLTSKQLARPSLGREASLGHRGSLYRGLSSVGPASARRERRMTAGTTASGRSEGSTRTNRSALPRRISMPVSTVGGMKTARLSRRERSMSMAPPPTWDRLHSSLQPDEEEGVDEDDIVDELQSRVTDIHEAKRWILGRRTSMLDVNGPAVVGRDVYDDMPMSAMRRPTYAASVFQQARLMEAERQVAATPGSSSMLNVNTPYPHTPGFPRTPLTAFPHTPAFPKTPLTALPEAIVQNEPIHLDDTAPATLPPPTFKQKTVHYLTTPILTMLDPREFIFPITLRKVALWIIYGGIITALVLLDRYYHWWHKFDHVVHGKNLAIMGVLYGFEPVMIMIIMLVARVPDARVVPDRTVLVPNGREGAESDSDDDSRSSMSSDEMSVAAQDMQAQMHSTILEEEHDDVDEQDNDEQDTQRPESGIVDKDNLRPTQRLSMRKVSSRSVLTPSDRAGVNVERRPSEVTNHPGSAGGLSVPRTPGFDPQLERTSSRRPSHPSHQMLLARTASRESCCNSYFGTYAAAAGSRLDGVTSAVTAPPPPVDDFTDEKNEKPLVATQSTSSGELEDEKKPTHLDDPSQPDEVRVDMTSITHPSLTESTALVIPCHNADVEVLKAVLFAALVHFEPWQIFVVDNGNTPTPPTKTWKPPSAHNPCSPASTTSGFP